MKKNSATVCASSSSNYNASKPPLATQSEFKKKKPSKSTVWDQFTRLENNNKSVGFYVLKLIVCKQKHIL